MMTFTKNDKSILIPPRILIEMTAVIQIEISGLSVKLVYVDLTTEQATLSELELAEKRGDFLHLVSAVQSKRNQQCGPCRE